MNSNKDDSPQSDVTNSDKILSSQNFLPKIKVEQNSQNVIEEDTSNFEEFHKDDKCENENTNDEEDTDMLLRSPHGVVAVDPRHGPPMAVVYAGPPSIQMATWGDRNGSTRSGRARSAHGQSQKASANGSSHNMRSTSAGGPAYLGAAPPPIPPLPVGYTSMHYNPHHPPNMVHPGGQPSMVLVPQPYHAHGTPSQIQHIHAPYQHPAHLQPSQQHGSSKHHQHHMVEQIIPEGKHLVPQPPIRNTNNIPKSSGGSSSNRYAKSFIS